MDWKTLRAAFPRTIPVLTGYLFLGAAYGVLMASAGYPAALAVGMSAAVYAGSMQFAAVPLLAGADPLGAFALTLLVNARHIFYGVAMLGKYRGAGSWRPYLIFALTDETFAVNSAGQVPPGLDAGRFYGAVSLLNQSYWVLATALGCALGAAARFDTRGISFVMTALFVSIFTGQWLDSPEHRPALAGLGAAAVCLALFGPDGFMLPAMGLIVALLLAMRPWLEGSGGAEKPAAGPLPAGNQPDDPGEEACP